MASSIDASTSGAGGVITTADNTGILNLKTAGTNAVTIDASQNVGIGTASPSVPLAVYKASDSSINIQNSTSGVTNVDGLQLLLSGSNGYMWNYESGANIFGTANTERMRIDSSGKVMFNTSSVLNAGYMSLLFDGSAINGFTIKNSSATFGPYLYFINSAGNVAGYVIQNGTTTVNYVTSSDYRMKEDVKPIENALEKVARLNPVTYTWKDTDNEKGEGFIAHELAEVCPLAVSGEKDAVNEDGSIKPQGIDTSFLVATLTAAIQEMKAIIDEQSARITALENK